MILGLDIGGTLTKFGVFDNDFSLIEKIELDTNAQKGFKISFGMITEQINKLKQSYKIKSAGIGVPGVISIDGTLINAPNLPGWNGVNLKEKLENLIDIPFCYDNDANNAARAELKLGTGRKLKNFLYLTIGTGIGGAIVINREIFRGDDGGAGEIGHIIIDNRYINYESSSQGTYSNQNSYGVTLNYRLGVLEEFTGRKKIVESAKSWAEREPDSLLNTIGEYDVKDISIIAEKGDAAAIKCLKEVGYYLGIGIASALNLLGIYNLVIGGGIAQGCEYLFEKAYKTVKQRALPNISKNVAFHKAIFGNNAGITGAAILAAEVSSAID